MDYNYKFNENKITTPNTILQNDAQIDDNVYTKTKHGNFQYFDFFSGFTAGCVGVFTGYPMDTLKVIMQSTIGIKNVNYRHICKNITTHYGVKGLYKGMGVPLITVGFQNSLFFGFYETFQRQFQPKQENESLKYSTILKCTTLSAMVQSVPASISELFKIQMQTNRKKKVNIFWVNSLIYKNIGIKGYFLGFSSTVLREVPALSIYLLFYEYFTRFKFSLINKDDYNKHQTPYSFLNVQINHQKNNHHARFIQLFLVGGISGSLSWFFTAPFDVIKSRLQSDNLQNLKYKNIFYCIKCIYQEGGVKSFMKGGGMSALRAFPVNGVTLSVYTTLLYWNKYLID